MKFRFKLEKMLHFMVLRETMKKMEISAVTRQLEFLKNRKALLQENIRSILEKTASEFSSEAVLYRSGKVELDVLSLEKLEAEIFRQERVLEEKREELSRIAMKRKGMESLKEKNHAEWRMQQSRRDQKRIDEVHQLLRK